MDTGSGEDDSLDLASNNWCVVTLTPVDDDGVEVELLRTVDWIECEEATVGSSVTLNLPELNINGQAEVVAIDDSPGLEDGPGRLVTGRFRHVADEILTLSVDGLDAPIQCTLRHPFWSVDAQEFVEAQHLRHGERLLTNTGETVRVISQTVASTATPVYNIEVHGEHVYRVTELGILVHNASWSTIGPSRPGGHVLGDVDAHGVLSPGRNRAVGNTNTKADAYVQSHHPIQNEWAKKNVANYNSNEAPAILLKSASGEPHALVSATQRKRRRDSGWSNDIRSEFNIAYRELIDSGVSIKQVRKTMRQSYKYFDSIGAF